MKMQNAKCKIQNAGVRSQGSGVRSQNLLFCLLSSVFCFLFFTGCASSIQQAKHDEIKGKLAIEKISIVGGGKEILVEASGPITYTAFKLSDPARLVLDIPGVDIEKVKAPIEVNNEFINRIVVASYGEEGMAPIARVEIGLKERVASDVKMGEGSILVFLNHEAVQQAKAPAVVEAQVAMEQEVAKKEEPVAAAMEETGPAPAEAEKLVPEGLNRGKEIKKADKLLKIETRKEKNRIIIKVIGNGPIGDFNSFTMDKPAPSRIVVDVWNVKSSILGDGLTVSSPYIKKVRVGEHPDKVRLVFDSGRKNAPPYTIERVENSLVITAGSIDAKKPEAAAAPVTAPPQPPAAAATLVPEPAKAGYAEIKGIDFEQLADKARLVITASKKMEYRLSKSQDETGLALDIKDAIIPDKLKRTLDASDLNTPILSISSFQAPAGSAKDVRIVVKLKEKANYDISQEGEKVQIDFPLQVAAQAVPKKAEIKSQESGVRSQELKEVKPTAEGKKEEAQASGYTGRKISLDFKDADIGNILRLMAEVSDLNIIAGEDVKGKVSLRLIDVPWDQAFDIILKTNGLGKVQEGNVIRILPIAKIKQEGEDALASRKAKEKLEDLETAIVPISYATASALEPQVKSVLSDRGSTATESRTNQLIIKDIPANIAKAKDLIRKLDTQTPQVLIEARIIEAQSSFARDLGVQWGASEISTRGTPEGNRFAAISSGSTAASSSITTSSRPGYAVNLPAAGSAGPLGALGFTFGKLTGDQLLLDLRITAGEKNGLTKTISRPRITTLDNKEAKISQGDSVPFETTSSSGTQTSFIDATLELTVTPHITPDGSISMKINAKRNSIGSFRSASGTPSISKKEATTEIIVKNGETTVIGGIVVADRSDTDSGVPLLKDIPLLGWFFKNKSVASSQTELLIFITPNIVKGEVELSPS